MDPKNNPCPCTQDCPDRVLGCRPKCERFQIYEKKRFAGYKENLRNFNTSGTLGHEQTINSKMQEERRHKK